MTELVIILTAAVIIYIVTHIRPLTPQELMLLAGKRRNHAVLQYYRFHQHEYVVTDAEFQKKMKPSGQFYDFHESLSRFPSVAAALLRYKKHEWVILAFEKDRQVIKVWLNKGPDGTTVSPLLSFHGVLSHAQTLGAQTVLRFHNHPDPAFMMYEYSTAASPTDYDSAKNFAAHLNPEGINWLDFVCEHGAPALYALSVADSFLPVSGFQTQLQAENGRSRYTNLLLHLERILPVSPK